MHAVSKAGITEEENSQSLEDAQAGSKKFGPRKVLSGKKKKHLTFFFKNKLESIKKVSNLATSWRHLH